MNNKQEKSGANVALFEYSSPSHIRTYNPLVTLLEMQRKENFHDRKLFIHSAISPVF